MAAQHYREAGEIDTLYYSTDDGESWHTYKFFNEVRIAVEFCNTERYLAEPIISCHSIVSLEVYSLPVAFPKT